MVNIVIYLPQNEYAHALVNELLDAALIANASIDKDNVLYRKEPDGIGQMVNTVITCQTKSMLFPSIEKWIKEKYGAEIPIFSMPIIQSNHSFDQLIRNSTAKKEP
jgi:uncharacterized protein involved in tolerance to divalent cations